MERRSSPPNSQSTPPNNLNPSQQQLLAQNLSLQGLQQQQQQNQLAQQWLQQQQIGAQIPNLQMPIMRSSAATQQGMAEYAQQQQLRFQQQQQPIYREHLLRQQQQMMQMQQRQNLINPQFQQQQLLNAISQGRMAYQGTQQQQTLNPAMMAIALQQQQRVMAQQRQLIRQGGNQMIQTARIPPADQVQMNTRQPMPHRPEGMESVDLAQLMRNFNANNSRSNDVQDTQPEGTTSEVRSSASNQSSRPDTPNQSVPNSPRIHRIDSANLQLNPNMERSAFDGLLEDFYLRHLGIQMPRAPTFAGRPLDFYMLFVSVMQIGGVEYVHERKLWKHVLNLMGMPTGLTSGGYNLRRHYKAILEPFEAYYRQKENELFDRGIVSYRYVTGGSSSSSNEPVTFSVPTTSNIPVQNIPVHPEPPQPHPVLEEERPLVPVAKEFEAIDQLVDNALSDAKGLLMRKLENYGPLEFESMFQLKMGEGEARSKRIFTTKEDFGTVDVYRLWLDVKNGGSARLEALSSLLVLSADPSSSFLLSDWPYLVSDLVSLWNQIASELVDLNNDFASYSDLVALETYLTDDLWLPSLSFNLSEYTLDQFYGVFYDNEVEIKSAVFRRQLAEIGVMLSTIFRNSSMSFDNSGYLAQFEGFFETLLTWIQFSPSTRTIETLGKQSPEKLSLEDTHVTFTQQRKTCLYILQNIGLHARLKSDRDAVAVCKFLCDFGTVYSPNIGLSSGLPLHSLVAGPESDFSWSVLDAFSKISLSAGNKQILRQADFKYFSDMAQMLLSFIPPGTSLRLAGHPLPQQSELNSRYYDVVFMEAAFLCFGNLVSINPANFLEFARTHQEAATLLHRFLSSSILGHVPLMTCDPELRGTTLGSTGYRSFHEAKQVQEKEFVYIAPIPQFSFMIGVKMLEAITYEAEDEENSISMDSISRVAFGVGGSGPGNNTWGHVDGAPLDGIPVVSLETTSAGNFKSYEISPYNETFVSCWSGGGLHTSCSDLEISLLGIMMNPNLPQDSIQNISSTLFMLSGGNRQQDEDLMNK